MSAPRILILGNSGSGKTTMASALAASLAIPHLDLDSIAWSSPRVRHTVPASVALLDAFVAAHPAWVIEGCYADLAAAAAPHCSELRFLNPGTEACLAHCRARPWEPQKFPSLEAQNEVLGFLLDWVRRYDTRDDEYGLARHRAVFDGFTGAKREYRE